MAALDLKPGPEVGAALEWLLEKVLDDPAINEPEILLSLLQSYENTPFLRNRQENAPLQRKC